MSERKIKRERESDKLKGAIVIVEEASSERAVSCEEMHANAHSRSSFLPPFGELSTSARSHFLLVLNTDRAL